MQVPDSPREIFAQRVQTFKAGLRSTGLAIFEFLGYMAQAYIEMQNTPISCKQCGTMVIRKETAGYYPPFDLPKGFPQPYGWCPACVAKLQKDIAEYWRMGREERILYMECERAQARGLPATLTTQEWEQTKKQFREHWAKKLIAVHTAEAAMRRSIILYPSLREAVRLLTIVFLPVNAVILAKAVFIPTKLEKQ
jgi:hypothetical protein